MSIFLSLGNYLYFIFVTTPVYIYIFIKHYRIYKWSRSFIVNLNEVNSSIYPTLEVISMRVLHTGNQDARFIPRKLISPWSVTLFRLLVDQCHAQYR